MPGEALPLRVALLPWRCEDLNGHVVPFRGGWLVPRGGLLMVLLGKGGVALGRPGAAWSYFSRTNKI